MFHVKHESAFGAERDGAVPADTDAPRIMGTMRGAARDAHPTPDGRRSGGQGSFLDEVAQRGLLIVDRLHLLGSGE